MHGLISQMHQSVLALKGPFCCHIELITRSHQICFGTSHRHILVRQMPGANVIKGNQLRHSHQCQNVFAVFAWMAELGLILPINLPQNPMWQLTSVPVNSLGQSDAYMRRWTGSSLVQIMACPCSPPSHYLNQCWNIVNWTFRNKLQWHFNRNSNIFIQEIAFVKMPSAKWRLCCLGLNELITQVESTSCGKHSTLLHSLWMLMQCSTHGAGAVGSLQNKCWTADPDI